MERNRADYLKLIAAELKRTFLGDEQLKPSFEDLQRISEATHVSDKTLRRILNGSYQSLPHVGTLDSLCAALGFGSFDQFVTDYQQKSSGPIAQRPDETIITKLISSNEIIRASWEFNKQHYDISQPLVVPLPYAADRSFWKNWAFCEAILIEPLSIQRINSKFRLNVEITDKHLAIYNNAGKRFIEEYYKSNQGDSEGLERFLNGKTDLTEYVIRTSPLRWSSGGVLPIVSYRPKGHARKSDWVLLFWRDLAPTAWTIPLGGAHDHSELTNLTKLLFREFSEEILLLDRHPSSENVFQKRFVHPDRSDNNYISTEFTNVQRGLRKTQDNLNISVPTVGGEAEIETVRSNMEVSVNGEITRSVLVSVNPNELGVEVVKVVRFEMDDDDYVLDGEFSEHDPPFLIRRPAMLLSLDFLRNLYHRTGELGKRVESDDPTMSDCREISGFSELDVHLFPYESELRSNRNKELSRENDSVEKRFMISWATKTDEQMKSGQIPSSARLGPVVWKNIIQVL